MAYPFLPVNPCCTDVVLNSPCGCSSTITNSGCNNNDPCSTHLTASSTIIYDGLALSCTTAEPCDTLNVILQKIDEIICNLLTQINLLNIQINNITQQIINIEGDIININNTLDVCCSATTTTTTTFAGLCTCVTVNITQEDIDLSKGNTAIFADNTVYVTGIEKGILCGGGDLGFEYTTPGTRGFCIQTSQIGQIQLYYVRDDVPVYFPATTSTYTVLYSNCAYNEECVPITSTTTTIP